jgi:membrane protease YdiL (CAAX protease family)
MPSRPDRSKTTLVDLLLVLGTAASLYGAGMITGRTAWGLLSVAAAWILAGLRMRRRGSNWRALGMRRPASWVWTLCLVVTGVLGIHGLVRWLKPALAELTGQPLDLSRFEALRGDPAALAAGLLVVWTIAAFGEEMVFRGFVLNRTAELFSFSRMGWIAAVLLSSLFFGLGHLYQGISGVILTFLVGFVYCAAYFLSGRCLWAPILIHGLYDTAAFLLIFLNWDRTLTSLM